MPILQTPKRRRSARARSVAVSASCSVSSSARCVHNCTVGASAGDPSSSSTTSQPVALRAASGTSPASRSHSERRLLRRPRACRPRLRGSRMAASSSGGGYLLVTGNGTVFSFGDARFHGSIPARDKDHVAAIVEAGKGAGYWLACDNGRISASVTPSSTALPRAFLSALRSSPWRPP